jgi:transcriptional regulator with XRE-family HTH domain
MIKTNKEIGDEIKRIRKTSGISQMKLAEEVGVSFQQIQKYEKGVNKISIEMIQRIAKALGISVSTFFEREKVPTVSEPCEKYYSKKKNVTGETSRRVESSTFPLLDTEEVALIKLFRKIKSKKIKDAFRKQLSGIVELEEQKES